MATVMWQRGRRLFSTAAVLIILTAVAHTAGQFGPSSGREEDQVTTAMHIFRISLGFGMRPSLLEIHKSLSFTMTITFLTLGILNLIIAGSRDTTDRLLHRVTWVNAVWVGAFLILNGVYRIPPPLISAAIIELVLLASLVFYSPRVE